MSGPSFEICLLKLSIFTDTNGELNGAAIYLIEVHHVNFSGSIDTTITRQNHHGM
jgi:hypothetical protein